MALASSDLIVLPYDTQFSRAGVEYARSTLHLPHNRLTLKSADPLRKIVAGVAFEMATRRWLEANAIRYNRLGATALTNPDRFDLAIGGRRCDLKSSLISDKSKIIELHRDSAWLLDAQALIPDDQFESERMGENDLYLFGFITGLEARHSADTQKALAKGLPVDLVHLLPLEGWGSSGGLSLGEVAIKSNGQAALEVEIVGQGVQRQLIREQTTLLPRLRTPLRQNYSTVHYLQASTPPTETIGLHSPALGQTHVIEPTDWANIWVYGQRVYLCGWLNKHDFRLNSQRLPAHSPVKQRRRTTVSSRALPIGALRPLTELAAIAPKQMGL